MQSPDFREVSRQHPLRELLKRYGFKMKGDNFCCPFHDDKHPSAHVYRSDHGYDLAQCHGCGELFDSVALTARMENVGLQEAAKLLAGYKPMKPQPTPEDDAPTFDPGPIPEDQLPKPGRELRYINSRGKESRTNPSAVYVYRSPDGVAQGVVVRVEKPDGGKAIWPIRWDAQKGRLVGKGWARNEQPPLYGAEHLVRHPDRKVLVVEGEKVVDALSPFLVLDEWVVVCWQGGADQARNRNFSLLNDREVTLWPDADPKGIAAMNNVAERCKPKSLRWLQPLEAWEPGFDGYDLMKAEGKQAVQNALANLTDPMEREVAPAAAPGRVLASSWLPEGIDELFQTQNGSLDTRAEQNVILVLNHHPQFKGRAVYDVFERHDMLDGRKLKHADAARLSVELRQATALNIGSEKLHTLLKAICQDNPVNVFGDMVRALAPKWDGKSRYISDYAGVEPTEWSQLVSRYWMTGLAHRVMVPGWKHDTILILEGKEGRGKSTFFEALGRVLNHEVTIPLSHITKDEELAKRMGGKAIFELAELNAMKGANRELFKDMITRPEDRFREKYGRDFIDAKRCGVFAATTNDSKYLTDPAGNRRIWPLKVTGRTDLEALARDVEQIWAEAAHRALSGERNWLDTEHEHALHAKEVEERENEDPMLAACLQAVQVLGDSGRIPTTKLYELLGISLDRACSLKVRQPVQEAMRKLGWAQSVEQWRVNGQVVRGYKLLPPEER